MSPQYEYLSFPTRAELDAWVEEHHWFRPLEVVAWGGRWYIAVNWRRNV